jgi:hypothetical protein
MGVRMRFRTDSALMADDIAARARGETTQWFHDHELDATPPAEPGDVWRVRWGGAEHPPGGGPIAGYEICCTTCKHVHAWTTATNCSTRREFEWSYVDKDGVTQSGKGWTCAHSGTGSCWTWTGSAEENTLSASPSLWSVPEKGGCGFHGYLTDGVLSG